MGYHSDATGKPAVDPAGAPVLLTPPASQRVEVQFRLNIANVSINPAFSGTDKTSDPLRLQLVRRSVADLPDWLAHNTNVRDAIVWEFPNGTQDYSSWTAQRKQLLRDRFAKA